MPWKDITYSKSQTRFRLKHMNMICFRNIVQNFAGNTDAYKVKTNYFDQPVKAQVKQHKQYGAGFSLN